MGGDERPLRPGSPRIIASVFRLITPLSPNCGFGLPVLASIEYSFPSPVPKTICAGVFPSPPQNSTPRVDGFPDGNWKAQSSCPVTGSTATTREYGVAMYMTPLRTSGVSPLGRKPEPNWPRPPRPAAGGA